MAGTFEVYEGADADGRWGTYGQRYDDHHQAIGGPIQITPEFSNSLFYGVTLTLDNGAILVEYDTPVEDSGFREGNSHRYADEYSTDGKLINQTVLGSDNDYGDSSFLHAIALSGGRYVGIIEGINSGIGDYVRLEYLHFVDATGHALDVPLYGESSGDGAFPHLAYTDPNLHANADGGFTVSYSARYSGGGSQSPSAPAGMQTYTATYTAAGALAQSVFVDFGHRTDLVTSDFTTVLSPTFFNLTLSGTDPINGRGNARDNIITGNVSRNHLEGGAGNDRLDGGLGSDYLAGGAGNDVFVFDTAIRPGYNSDTIGDFRHGTDKIELSSAIFSYYKAGSLSASSFSDIGSGHPHPAAHIVYDAAGNLFYDPDGAGTAASPIQFATLSGHPHLTASDFVVT